MDPGGFAVGSVPRRTVTATCDREIQGLSLISFHRFLITAAILFCAGYGVYELLAVNGSLVVSGFFFVFTAALTYYLRHLKRFLGVEE